MTQPDITAAAAVIAAEQVADFVRAANANPAGLLDGSLDTAGQRACGAVDAAHTLGVTPAELRDRLR